MDLPTAIRAVIADQNLTEEAMTSVMHSIMNGEASPAQIGGFLVGLRAKGETVAEITAAARVMRSFATPVAAPKEHLVDTCGTGGDGLSTFNISTTCAFVVAAAGGRVAKHGNRSVSGRTGSADILEAAGVEINLEPDQVARSILEVGVGFMFAPLFHRAMRHASGPRRELGVRTIFNVLGPLTNPAGAPNQIVGVYSDEWLQPVAEVLRELGSEHAMVVHASDGMDEISISAPTRVVELNEGDIRSYTLSPGKSGFQPAEHIALSASGPEDSLRMMRSVLDDVPGAPLDIVLFNAGAAIYVAGLADDLREGVEQARDAIASGKAREKLKRLIEFTNSL